MDFVSHYKFGSIKGTVVLYFGFPLQEILDKVRMRRSGKRLMITERRELAQKL